MTAGEDELESLVGECRRRPSVSSARLGHLEQAGLRGQRAIAADAVDGAVARRRHQPGARVGGHAVARPALRGDRERLLRGFLGEVEVAEEADQGSEDASPLVAEDLLEGRYHSTIGRTSIAPPRRAAGIRAASSIAASRSSASKKQVAADRLLDLDERAVGGQRLAVLHPDGGRRLGVGQLQPGRDAGRLVDRLVVGVDGASARLRTASPTARASAASGMCPGGSTACTSSLPPVANGRL